MIFSNGSGLPGHLERLRLPIDRHAELAAELEVVFTRLGAHFRDMGQDAVVIADSTSWWC